MTLLDGYFKSHYHLAHLTSTRFSTWHCCINHLFPPTWSTDCQECLPLPHPLPLSPLCPGPRCYPFSLCSPPKLNLSHASSMAFLQVASSPKPPRDLIIHSARFKISWITAITVYLYYYLIDLAFLFYMSQVGFQFPEMSSVSLCLSSALRVALHVIDVDCTR